MFGLTNSDMRLTSDFWYFDNVLFFDPGVDNKGVFIL